MPPKSRLAAAAGSILLGLGGIALGFYLKPFEAAALLQKLALRRGGVARVQAGSLAAYEKDLCEPAKPCRCVALIHGLGDSALTWDNVLLGRGGAAPPPVGYRLLAVELPGSEGSAAPSSPDGYRIPALADAVRASLEPRCPEWTVAGNSLGGWVAAWLAVQWPQGVRRLILINAAGLADPTGVELETARVLEAPTVATLKAFMLRAYHTPRWIPERAWPSAVASIRARPAAAIVAALREEDLLDRRAREIRAPTRVLWGASDRAIPEAVGRGFARLIPGARFELLPKCGHLPQRECPAAVTAALYDPQP
jgi:pimeloyl-ACP methyl ester carboxylesterase